MRSKSTRSSLAAWLSIALISFVALALVNCGGTNEIRVNSNPPTGTIRVSLSDPPPCKFPAGTFKKVYVTVRSVQAHVSGTADDAAAGWQELAPQLANAPMQVDLLSQASNQCTLASLGSNAALPAGTYQQIRLLLVSNNPAAGVPVPPMNACGSMGFNCVVLSDDSVHQLELSSQANTGLKIPPGQVVGGPIMVGDGQTVDLNIDFNTCASIVRQGNGKFRLKPTLTAGQVSTQTAGLGGQVVDSATMMPIPNGNVIVALEQPDSTGVDRVVMQAATDANGNFNFCPLPMGTFDVVVVGSSNGTSYGPTVLVGVSTGASLGKIPLAAETAMPPAGLATIMGTVSTASGTAPMTAAFSADVSLAALQQISLSGGGMRLVTIPLTPDSTAAIATAAGMTCPMGTNCADYMLKVPASNPTVGTLSMGTFTFAPPAMGDVLYRVEASAFVPMSGGTATCTPPIQTTNLDSTDMPLKVAGGMTTTAKRIDFTGCM